MTANKNEVQKTAEKPMTVVDYLSSGIHNSLQSGMKAPEGYDVDTAIQSAYLKILEAKDMNKKPALEVCTQQSLVNAVRSMVIMGLQPDKTQGYFIVRGNQLTFMPSYFGMQMMIKRDVGVKDVYAQVVLKGDELETEIRNGEEYVVEGSHKRKRVWDGKPQMTRENIVGAYAIVKFPDGSERHQIMDKEQLEQAWTKSSSKAQSVHNEFPEQMAHRTVINRLAKKLLNTSTDERIRQVGSALDEVMSYVDNDDEIYTPPAQAYSVGVTPDEEDNIIDAETQETPKEEAEKETPEKEPQTEEQKSEQLKAPF